MPTVTDSFLWLEDGEDPKVLAWIKQQNEKTDAALRTNRQKQFLEELIAKFQVMNFTAPIPVNGRYFYTERQPNQDQMVLFVKTGLEGQPVELVNPNIVRADHTATLDFWQPSRSGRFVAYGVSQGGDEMSTLRVKDVEMNQDLSDAIANCRYTSVCWLPDESGFFHTRNPKPGTVPKDEETMWAKTYVHRLGDDPETDEMIFGEGRPKDDMTHLVLSTDGTLLAIHVSQEWTHNDVYLYHTQDKSLSPLFLGLSAKFQLAFLQGKVAVKTNYKADRSRVLVAGLAELTKPIDEWQELMPEREWVLGDMEVTKDRIVLSYLVNACAELVMLDHEGNNKIVLDLPPYSSLVELSTVPTESEFFYSAMTFTQPKQVFRVDPGHGVAELYRGIPNPLNPEDYVVKQEWYQSKDGTRVPLFLFHKKEVVYDGTNPTILYGYGGFGSEVSPMFMRHWVPWLERGGVFAAANIRGGGEFGETWHTGGIKEHKQNSFDDFIAAAEYLIAQQVTNTRHLGILGGSNGGLLVSAVAVQRPELFEAVCSMVPLTDMVRFHKFGMAARWVHEYGDPENEQDLEHILQWSPYHNVKEGTEYPNILLTTANKDTRVDPLHARKMAARLQEVNKKKSVLLLSEEEAGHGPGKPVSKFIETQSLILIFFADNLGLPDTN